MASVLCRMAASVKSRCTTAKYRRVVRWEHEAVLESVQTGLI
jgi:hypothetical protein